MLNISKLSVEKIVEIIENKRAKSKRKFDKNYEKIDKLIKAGKWKKPELISKFDKDVLGYYPIYAKAEKKEKQGNLRAAAKLYWKNIFVNGTDAPANFRRLLIVLDKLNELEDELKVARVYLHFVGDRDQLWLGRRIKRLQKKLSAKS